MIRMSTLFPEPFSPTNPTIVPGRSSNETPRSTSFDRRLGHTPVRKALWTSAIARVGVALERP